MKSKPNDGPLDSYLSSLGAHQREQAQAACDMFGDVIASFYLRLRANGVPPAATLDLTKTYMAAMVINGKES